MIVGQRSTLLPVCRAIPCPSDQMQVQVTMPQMVKKGSAHPACAPLTIVSEFGDACVGRFDALVLAILHAQTPFGYYANKYVLGKAVHYEHRIRDIFPILRVSSVQQYLPCAISSKQETTIYNLANMCLAGLSFLDGQSAICIDNVPTILQQEVHKRISQKTFRM